MTDRAREIVEHYKQLRSLVEFDQSKAVVNQLINLVERQEERIYALVDEVNGYTEVVAIQADTQTSTLNTIQNLFDRIEKLERTIYYLNEGIYYSEAV